MNTQAQARTLAAGQALQLPARMSGPAVLVEGELLVQEPARWLGGSVVVPRAIRLVAPAVVDVQAAWSVVAMGAATVVLPAPVPALATARLLALVARARELVRRWGPQAGAKTSRPVAG